MISVRNLTFAFGAETALRDVSFDLEEGRALAVMGPSGSGKTTLLRLLAGLEEPGGGEVWLRGELASRRGFVASPASRGVGMVFQQRALWPHMTVEQNVAFGLAGLPRPAARERSLEALAWFGLEGLGGRRPHELSGGQAQRVALARALAPSPRFLLLDEPFSHLDEGSQALVMGRLEKIREEGGTTLVVVLHEHPFALRLCSEALLLEGGSVEARGSWEEVRPRSRALQAAMDALAGRGRP